MSFDDSKLLTSFFNKSASQISLRSWDLEDEYEEKVFVTFDDAEDALNKKKRK